MSFLSAPILEVGCPTEKAWPITSPFGAMDTNLRTLPHRGIDIGCPLETPVLACFDGVIVLQIKDEPGLKTGNCIWLNNYEKMAQAGYFHLSGFRFANPGQKVKQGDIIGYSGATGNVTGPHLHFQLNVLGKHDVYEPRFVFPG